MGLESERVTIRVSGAPVRCPFCHADVDHESDAWVACVSCLARHHGACWQEGNGCASCGHAVSLEGTPSAATADLPCVTIKLRMREAHAAEVDATVPVLVHRGEDERFAVRVENDTGAPQRVELRHLPAFLRLEGAAIATVAPGESATFPVLVHEPSIEPRAGTVMWLGEKALRFEKDRAATTGTFIVSSDDDARTVAIRVFRDAPLRTLLGLGMACGLFPFPFGFLGLLLGIAALVKRIPAGTKDVASTFDRAVALSDRRTGLIVLASELVVFAAVVGALFLTTRA